MKRWIPLLAALATAACTDMVNETDTVATEASSESDAGASATETSDASSTSDAGTTADTTATTSADTTATTGDDASTTAEPSTGSTGAGEPAPICGDGLVEPPEVCDDGNELDHDGCDATCSADAGASRWFDVYPGVTQEDAELFALTRALDGSIIAAGYERSPYEPMDWMPRIAWMRAYSPAGALLWSRVQDLSPLSDSIHALLTAPNGDLITGGVAHNSWCTDGCFYGQLSRHDPFGELLWSTMSDELDGGFVWDIAIGHDGSVYGVGGTDSWVEPPKMRIMRVSEDGALLWSKILNPGEEDNRGSLSAIAARPDGALIVAGAIRTYEPGVHSNDADAWLAELTPEGDIAWSERIDGAEGGHDAINDLALSDEGDILLTGRVGVDVQLVPNNNDVLTIAQRDAVWLLRRGEAGAPVWETTFDELSSASGLALALHPERIVVAGSSELDEDTGLRLSYVSFTHAGALNGWSATSEGPLRSSRAVIAVENGDPDGALYLAGVDADEAWVGRFESAL